MQRQARAWVLTCGPAARRSRCAPAPARRTPAPPCSAGEAARRGPGRQAAGPGHEAWARILLPATACTQGAGRAPRQLTAHLSKEDSRVSSPSTSVMLTSACRPGSAGRQGTGPQLALGCPTLLQASGPSPSALCTQLRNHPASASTAPGGVARRVEPTWTWGSLALTYSCTRSCSSAATSTLPGRKGARRVVCGGSAAEAAVSGGRRNGCVPPRPPCGQQQQRQRTQQALAGVSTEGTTQGRHALRCLPARARSHPVGPPPTTTNASIAFRSSGVTSGRAACSIVLLRWGVRAVRRRVGRGQGWSSGSRAALLLPPQHSTAA